MYPRVAYEMTEDDLKAIIAACNKPAPVMFLPGGQEMFSSRQEDANRAWAELGQRMGFDPMTVRSIEGKGQRFFTAVVSETDAQRTERLAREVEEKRQTEISQLNTEIAERQKRLAELEPA